MGEWVDRFGTSNGCGRPGDSVTDYGGPVLLAATTPELERGAVLAGRYQIEAVIGTGGSGRVLRAFDRVARAPVALKILRREFVLDPVWAERFARELRVGRQIQNPHVCRVFDIGEAEGNRFLSMELATGGTIRAQIRQIEGAAPRPLDQRIADAWAVVEGVAAIHAAGIVHRDIKPENILRMGDGRLVVSDFGLATDPGSGPATTLMVGTPTYMAPEVVMGDPATARSDVWALGVVLHEILFGRRPDRSISSRGRRRFIPPELTTVKERRLAALCGRCSEDAAQERPSSAGEVLRELAHALSGRRRLSRMALGRQITWAGLGIASIVGVLLVGSRWTNRAAASSREAAVAISDRDRVATPEGTPEDWGHGSTRLAAFGGRLHCFSLVGDGRKVRVIWGSPRKAEDIDIGTGRREPARLLPRTYQQGCPQLSPDQRSLLFEGANGPGSHIFLSQSPDGSDAKPIVRGTSPKWLPNGQEFAFGIDTRHVGVFSIPSEEMTVVTDGEDNVRQLGELAVDSSGSHLAIRYITGTVENQVVIHALPSLGLVKRTRIPAAADRLQLGSNGSLLFSLDGPGGYQQMVSSDFGGGHMKRLGEISHANVLGALETESGLVVVGSSERSSLRVDGPSGSTELTNDGESVSGSLSANGDLLVERRLKDGRLVMVLRSRGQPERQVTEGPVDVTPSFVPDRGGWIYSRLNTAQIIECTGTMDSCAVVHCDRLIPAFPAVDPTGTQIAYLTLMNVARVRIISRQGTGERDFGPAGGDACAPFWSGPDRLWVAQSVVGLQMTWVEIDTRTGRRTGESHSAHVTGNQDCVVPSSVLAKRAEPPGPRVRSIFEDTSELFWLAGRGAI